VDAIFALTSWISEGQLAGGFDLALAIHCWQFIHIGAYIVCIKLTALNEMAFKLTPETIQVLIKHHKEVFSTDTAKNLNDWSGRKDCL
jgi:hypothetical protein